MALDAQMENLRVGLSIFLEILEIFSTCPVDVSAKSQIFDVRIKTTDMVSSGII